MMPKRILTLGLVGCIGCTANPDPRNEIPFSGSGSSQSHAIRTVQTLSPRQAIPRNDSRIEGSLVGEPDLLIESELLFEAEESAADGRDVSLVDYILNDNDDLQTLSPSDITTQPGGATSLPTPTPTPITDGRANADFQARAANQIDLNLPSTLAAIGGQHPVVGFAQWRVQEAYAQLAQAKALWLPTIHGGFGFHRHDGNYQASSGEIVDVNRNSFQYGLGTGATGAGTTQRPGLRAQFHFADAIFRPKIATKTAWARGHAAGAALNRQLLDAAVAYNNLVGAYQDLSILRASKVRTTDLTKITKDFAEAGQGLQADADRMQTELALMETRLLAAEEQVAVASARLAEAISLDGAGKIVPMDAIAVPLDMAQPESDVASLIGTGLAMRPELKESQALVAAACEAFKREKYAPFVPSVLLGFSTGGFGGGLGNNLDDVEGRYDFDALVSWEVRNLGLGEKAARREQTARVEQAKFERVRVMDRVAREVSEGHARVINRRRQIQATERAIGFAETSYDRNLKRIRDGEGLPLEALQSLQALEQARRAYLQAVVGYNQAQFELQWAQGWPVQAP